MIDGKIEIRMLKAKLGSEDGIKVNMYKEGSVYKVKQNLGKAFVDDLHVAEYYSSSEDLEKPEPVIIEMGKVERTLDDPPKTWVGLIVKEMETGEKAAITKVLRAGRVALSDDRVIDYRIIRKEWEIIEDGD